MSQDAYSNYHRVLRSLPVNNPTFEDIVALCPHLDAAHIDYFQQRFLSRQEIKFASPSVKVDGACWAIYYNPADRQGNVLSGRTRRAYEISRGELAEFGYIPAAIAFARATWVTELVSDAWTEVGRIRVQDPTELTSEGYPTTKHVIYYGLRINPDDVYIYGMQSTPSMIWDTELLVLTLDPLVGKETLGGRPGFTHNCCAYCAGGLKLDGCSCCNKSFRDDHSRTGWETPLSKKMVELLVSSGHIFGQNPEIAWQQERETFLKPQS